MINLFRNKFPYLLTLLLIAGCSSGNLVQKGKKEVKVVVIPLPGKVNNFKNSIAKRKLPFSIPYGSKVTDIKIDSINKTFKINLNRQFSFMPFRDGNVNKIYSYIKNYFGNEFKGYKFSINTLGFPIEDFIPNYFRKSPSVYDNRRIPPKLKRPVPVAENISKKFIPSNGLFDKNIAVAPSHGWYYNSAEGRWEWQRPRLFQSVEDLLPSSFCIPYLIPMLENAGATVFDPRERDVQTNSVVVDNNTTKDVIHKRYIEIVKRSKYKWKNGEKGFAQGNPPYPVDYNPFTKGTFRTTTSDSVATASISWIPDIPATGYYAVYISYAASSGNVSDAHYTVYHEGIKTEFLINQQIGGSTWLYLGKFKFKKGYNPEEDKVVLNNKSKETGKKVTADAVRFGGGMGVVIRGGSTSGRPKFVEASRYYLQYAGIPDSIYSFNNNKDDYNDDKRDRSMYVNYINGSSVNDEKAKGVGVPIDLSLAFHTDAGVRHDNKSIGTLALYAIRGEHSKTVFPNGVSRFASRDFADIMQTQIVNDIRAKYDPEWNRRQVMDEEPSNDNYPQQYSEVYMPNVPAVLIELLSHQNFFDMEFGQDPRFRFDVARAMYKGMLRFLSIQDHFKYVVEPLPVKNFMTEMKPDGDVYLSWRPVKDPLEPTAKADAYIVYTRIGNGDFDNGTLVNHPYAEFKNLMSGVIYSYKVTAINKGGESFPSEILSVCRMNNDKKPVLIINGFDRVSAPAIVKSKDYQGFDNQDDPGVPYKYDISFTGRQYNFNPKSQWKTNDNSGWGASYANYEDKVIAGNTFDYPFVHGMALKENGYPFVSASEKSVMDGEVDLSKYKLVDLILGEQKKTHHVRAVEDSLQGIEFKTIPAKLQAKIKQYCDDGGNIFISGAYVGSDLFRVRPVKKSDKKFAEEVLKYKLYPDCSSKEGKLYSSNPKFMPKFSSFSYNTTLNDSIYAVENGDAINSVNGSKVLLRYTENEFPAATGYKGKYGVIVFGFPFETINLQTTRDKVMKAVLEYLGI